VCVCVCVYFYIYIEREREREIDMNKTLMIKKDHDFIMQVITLSDNNFY